MVTIKDLAKKTGYTVATVSRALNKNPLVAEATREKILLAAKEIGYLPNALARGLVMQATSTVGVIVPDITNPYFPAIVKAIQDTLKLKGYHTIVCNTDWRLEIETELAKTLFAHRVAGIIMDPLNDLTYEHLRQAGVQIPIVFFGNRTDHVGDEASSVLINNFSAAERATQYLIDLGHRKIAFVGGGEDTYVNRSRVGGYAHSMAQKYGKADPSLIIRCNYSQQEGFAAANKMIEQCNIPTAILAGNDIIAFGIMQRFRSQGYRIPEDISVVGFDDIEFSENLGLTTMQEPRYEMGRIAADMLLDNLGNAAVQKEIHHQHVVKEAKLVIRDTCATPSTIR